MNIVVIYHKGCIDGTVAAAVVLKKFPKAKLFPLGHGYEPEDLEPILAEIDSDTTIYTVDCGSGAEELLAKGFSVTTLDHHIGVKERFEERAAENEHYTFIFDNEKSGASLAWSHFFPDEEIPEFIKYVEDIDLGRGEYADGARGVGNYLYMFCDDPEAMLKELESDFEELRKKGAVAALSANKEIEEQLTIPPIMIRIGEHEVLAYNISIHKSMCATLLSEKENQTVAIFTMKGDVVNISFRGHEGQVPTPLTYATILGGGGHEYAAAARVSLPDFLKMIILPS